MTIRTDPIEKHPTTRRTHYVAFSSELPSGVLIDAVVALIQSPATPTLVVDQATVGAASIEDADGVTHLAGTWVSFRMAAGTNNVDYEVLVSVTSDDDTLDPLAVVVPVKVRSN